MIGDKYHPDKFVTITIDTSKETSDLNFAQKSRGVNSGITHGWFSFNEHSSLSETLDTSSESGEVSITIAYDKMECVTITPGSW